MSDFVQIANVALDLVGQSQIMSLDDQTPAARKSKLHIYDAIREVLAAGLWKAARKPSTLSELSPVPEFGWAHRYQLPSDYIRFVTLNDTDPNDQQPPMLEVRGRELHTDETTASLVYICDLGATGNDINAAGPLLTELFSLKLAVKLAWLFQQSATRQQQLKDDYYGSSGSNGRLSKALAQDAREGKKPLVNQLFQSNWVRDRLTSTNGFAPAVVLGVVALFAGLAWLVKPSLFPGASKRAAQSTQATAHVEQATAKVDAAVVAQGATAAASVTKIGEANTAAPPSPAREFIGREVSVALTNLPAPDPQALLEAERRRSAVMEGRADEARRLYETEAAHSAKLQRERDVALAARDQANAQRHAVDLSLEQAAAAEHAHTMQTLGVGAIALLAFAAWAYARFYSITPASLGRIAADVRAGVDPIAAMDTHLAPWLHAGVNRAARLATDPTSVAVK